MGAQLGAGIILAQDMPGQIQRTADQNSRLRVALRQVLQGCVHIACLKGGDGTAPARFGQICTGNSIDFIWNSHRGERGAMRCNGR